MAIRLIVDTGVGDDVDDPLALAARSPEVELVGVATVYRCAELRARRRWPPTSPARPYGGADAGAEAGWR